MTNALIYRSQLPLGAHDRDPWVALDAWRDHLTLLVGSGELRPATAEQYTRSMNGFSAWLEERNQTATRDTIRAWLADLNTHYRPSSVNVFYSGVRAFFTWAVNEGYMTSNPTTGIKGAKREGTKTSHKRQPLTDAEVVRLLSQPDLHTPSGYRDYTIMCLMLYTGVRTIEVYRADLEDLRRVGNSLVLDVQGKGHDEKDAYVVLANPQVQDAIYTWVAMRGDDPGPLFWSLSNNSKHQRLTRDSIRRSVKGYLKAAGISDRRITTHSLRHTAITAAVRGGASLVQAQNMARHTDPKTTMIYIREVNRAADPAEARIEYGD